MATASSKFEFNYALQSSSGRFYTGVTSISKIGFLSEDLRDAVTFTEEGAYRKVKQYPFCEHFKVVRVR